MFLSAFRLLFLYLVSPLLLLVQHSFPGSRLAGGPVNTLNKTSIELVARKPPFPSRDECYYAIAPGQPPTDRTLYWTGFPETYSKWQHHMDLLDDYVVKYKLRTATDSANWYSGDFKEPENYQGSITERVTYVRNMFWAFSARTKGKVYLLMPYNTAPRLESQFWRFEWPALRDGGLVTEIIWIDARLLDTAEGPPDPLSVTKTWWKLGNSRPATYRGVAPPAPKPPATSKAPKSSSTTQTSRPRPQGTLGGFLNPRPLTTVSATPQPSVPTPSPSTLSTTTSRTRGGGLRPGFFNRPASTA